MEQFFHISFLVCLGYFLLINLYYLVILGASWLEARLRVRQSTKDELEFEKASPFSIPVSVVVAAYNEATIITDTVYSILRNQYPQFEVIVVNDGSTDETLEVLTRDFDLEPTTRFYRNLIATMPVKQVYRSKKYTNLFVADKDNGGTHADAANVGLNLSRYRYVLGVDADTFLEKDAILKTIRLALRDPKRTVGVGSLIGIQNGLKVQNGAIRKYGLARNISSNLQFIEYMRAFLVNRLGWSRGNYTMCISGAYSLWRRDVLIELGGFHKDFSCDDLELTYRMHDHFRREKIPYNIVSLPDPVCWTEAPTNTYSLYQQRHRWQRVKNETAIHYFRMLFNPRYGKLGFLGAPYMFFAEVIGPWIEFFSYILIPLGWLLGALSFAKLGFFLLCSAGLTYTLSLLAVILFDRSYPNVLSVKDIIRLSIVGVAEFLGFRQTISVARFVGSVASLFGVKTWNKFERERPVAVREAA